MNSQSTYLAYLLRLWQTKDAGRLVWRASLEDPHTGERKGFSSPEAMVAFLWDQVQKCEREGGEGQKQKKADP